MEGAVGQVVKSYGCGARGPKFESGCHQKCWAVIELFVHIYLYEFILCSVDSSDIKLFMADHSKLRQEA